MTNAEIAEKIVRKHGGICLVPTQKAINDPKTFACSSHENTFCDCEVEKLIVEAISIKDSYWRDKIREKEELE